MMSHIEHSRVVLEHVQAVVGRLDGVPGVLGVQDHNVLQFLRQSMGGRVVVHVRCYNDESYRAFKSGSGTCSSCCRSP